MLFLKRYHDVINQREVIDSFCEKMDITVKFKLVDLMEQFSEPLSIRTNRYNSFAEKTDAFKYACHKFNDMMSTAFTKYICFEEYSTIKAAIQNKRVSWIYSIIELQYEALSEDEKRAFAQSLNEFFKENDIPWRILDGIMIKIDAEQFECDLRAKALESMKELKDAEPIFQSAYNELVSTQQLNTNADTKKSHRFRGDRCKVFETNPQKSLHFLEWRLEIGKILLHYS